MITRAAKRSEELQRLEKYAPLEHDTIPGDSGILLSDKISFLANYYQLIDPFSPDNLKPAGYELTIGNEYFIGGEYHDFDEIGHADHITIPPFEVAVIKTAETICLPRFLIARWNLRVRFAYKGLLWVGAAQVDPGYVGNLFCPLYNLSNKPVTLLRGEQIALMDFSKTTRFWPHSSMRYKPKNPRPIIEDFGAEELKSALFHEVGAKIESFEKSAKDLQGRFSTFASITFATLAIVVSAIAILFQLDKEWRIGAALWGPFLVGLSVFTLSLSAFNYLNKAILHNFSDRIVGLLGSRIFLLEEW